MSEIQTQDQPNPHGRIIQEDITTIMQGSYIDYSMSVIVDRALPDVRDGFKPVHRRILFAMNDLGLHYHKAHKKSARIVGEVLGKYHPHGDTSVYGALVRMAQSWSMSQMLIDGQGNFGNQDGDPEAAMRYTEARLSKIGGTIFEEINKNTVDWVNNFDDSLEEPSVLPVMFPQLLVNGGTGIAVGMASSVLPHNLREVVAATIAIIENPNITDEELLAIMPAPDFPTGGVIYGIEGPRRGALTGRGSVRVRGEYVVEVDNKGKETVIITSVPYTISRDNLTEQISELIKEKKLEGITDLNNESNNREGTRIVLEIHKNFTAGVVMNHVYKHTSLQSNFTINNTVLVNGAPREISSFAIIREWIKFRFEVVKRRLNYDIAELARKLELLVGCIIVLNDVDRAIEIIKNSQSPAAASAALCEAYGLTEVQAKYILDLRLAKITSMEIESIRNEHAKLTERYNELTTIVNSDELVYEDIKATLREISDTYGTDRQSRIDYAGEDVDNEDFIEQKDIIITVSDDGYIKRTNADVYRVQSRGGQGKLVAKTKDDDHIKHVLYCNTHTYLFVFTDAGKCYYTRAHIVPNTDRTGKGRPIQNFLDIPAGEKIISLLTSDTFEGKNVVLSTKLGITKNMTLQSMFYGKKKGLIAILIEEGDALIGAVIANPTDTILIANKIGNAIRFPLSEFREMGRKSIGNYAIKDRTSPLVSVQAVDSDDLFAITIGSNGFGKKTPIDQYRITGRNNNGISTMNCTEKTGHLVKLLLAKSEDNIMISCKSGKSIRISVDDIKTISRNTQGVILVDIADGDEIADATVIYDDTEEE